MSGERTQRKPGLGTYIRDTVLFTVGIAIGLSQAGIPPFDPPPGGPDVELLIFAGLLCNGPVMLQALALRFGSTGSQSPTPQPEPPSSPELSPAPSSGGE